MIGPYFFFFFFFNLVTLNLNHDLVIKRIIPSHIVFTCVYTMHVPKKNKKEKQSKKFIVQKMALNSTALSQHQQLHL